jgi:hypothetical protein
LFLGNESAMDQKESKLQNDVSEKASVRPTARRASTPQSPSHTSRLDYVRNLQAIIGNRAAGQWIQAKLKVGAPNDIYEQEADRVADQIISASNNPASAQRPLDLTGRAASSHLQRQSLADDFAGVYDEEAGEPPAPIVHAQESDDLGLQMKPVGEESPQGQSPSEEDENYLQRKPAFSSPAVSVAPSGVVQRQCACGRDMESSADECAECKKEHEGSLQRVAASTAGVDAAPPIVDDVLRSSGQPLDHSTRAFFEPRFGFNLDGVRVHADAQAARSADAVRARAYTVGSDIVFAENQLSVSSDQGRRLLAHELAHVVQQASAPTPLVQRGPGGGQGDQKFFDPSRGALTDAEKAKLLAVRRSLNLPDTATPSDTTIVGILITETGEEIPFHSGERGGYHGGVRPADVKGGPGSSTNRINRTHVETWAINAMRKQGLKRGVLLIELEPCAVCGGYGKGNPTVDTKVPGVSGQLPEDAQLIVVDGQSASYFRQTPTDPQKPTRVSPKAPKGQGGVKAPAATDVDPGGAGTGKSPQVRGQGGVKAPAAADVDPGGAGTSKSPQVRGQGGVKAPAATDVDPGGTGKTGATTPAQKTTGTPSRSSGLAIEVGTGITTLGLSWLAAYLKGKVDQKIAQRQINAFLDVAKKKINANPDEAVKKMMLDPYRTVYAWVYLESSVITTFGVDSTSIEPPTSASAPIIDLSRIDYMTAPVDQSLIESFPKISGGGRHFTVTSQFVIDIPLTTPPLEALINYAKARNLSLDDLYNYVSGRYQYALSSFITRLEALQKIREAQQSIKDSYQKLQAQLKIAKKLKDVELQKSIAEKLESTRQSLSSFPDREKRVEEIIQKGNQDVKYWEHILDLVKPTTPRP